MLSALVAAAAIPVVALGQSAEGREIRAVRVGDPSSPRMWRRSRRGTRYYSGSRALSERESRIVARLIERIRPAVTVWYHQPWGAVLLPCDGPAPLERRYMKVARFPGQRCRGAGLRGTATSWQRHELGSNAFVVELPASVVSTKATRRHAAAVISVAGG